MGNEYTYQIGLTQQFRHCGNPFRIDSYKGCDFGCKYCFATTKNFVVHNGGDFKEPNIEKIKKFFYKALETDAPPKNINIECMRHRVPLHLGGMSDPFQSREWKYGVTYEILKLTNQYYYPMMISTKTDSLPKKYWEILNPEIHAFQISLMGINEDYVRRFEINTPSPINRINFIKELKTKGFWVGVRIQPLISLEEALEVVKAIGDIVDYITVEHLKISVDDKTLRPFLFNEYNNDLSLFKCTGKNYELRTDIKKSNIEKIKALAKCPVGCGDNDLHCFSDSLNCCGIDTINSNFDNWLKYNSTYINKTNNKDNWYPTCNCSGCFNSSQRKKGFNFKNYVDYFIENPKPDKKINIKL